MNIVRVKGAAQFINRCRKQINQTPNELILMSFILNRTIGLNQNGKEIKVSSHSMIQMRNIV